MKVGGGLGGSGLIDIQLYGLRDAEGRFTKATLDMRLYAAARGEACAKVLQEIYRRHAPKSDESKSEWQPSERAVEHGHTHFFEGITADVTFDYPGWAINLDTDDPDLALWLREGTGPHVIYPGVFTGGGNMAEVLHFFGEDGSEVYTMGVWHPGVWGTHGNPHWEEDAWRESAEVVDEMLKGVAGDIVATVSGGPIGKGEL
jgi:hypothetical protein